MKIVLATGIYPPDIGGPATYVRALAERLSSRGDKVIVISYGERANGKLKMENGKWTVLMVHRRGGPLLRWMRYAKALREIAADADIVEAFSSVSVGIPMMLARLKKPRKILRLGGDFIWERYTAMGGGLGLRDWYARGGSSGFKYRVSGLLLRAFDHIVFSTKFQEEIYEKQYPGLPRHSVIENALPNPGSQPNPHLAHKPFRLLVLSRLVKFKNVPALIAALPALPDTTLTVVGSGPEQGRLEAQAKASNLADRIRFLPSVEGAAKQRLFDEHDLLVIPSITDISPNAALEARAAGLPVLLTRETGLSPELTSGMVLADLGTSDKIVQAIRSAIDRYDAVVAHASEPMIQRGWDTVSAEHLEVFRSLLSQDSFFLCPSDRERTKESACAPRSHAPLTRGRPQPPTLLARAAPGGSNDHPLGEEKLLMISGDRSILAGKKGAFWYTLEEMCKHWERIDVICPGQLLTGNNSQLTFFGNVFFHPSPRSLWYQPFWIRRKGRELIAAHHHSVMTVHEYPPFYNGIGARWLLKQFPRVRSVLEIHHVVGFPEPSSVAERIARVLNQWVLPSHAGHFDAVRTVSPAIGATLRSLGVAGEKISVVPSFYLNRDMLQPDSTIAKQYDVVCCGRLVANKNIPLLLSALSRLPTATALIIGDGPERKQLERLTASLGMQRRVTFAGWLPDQQAVTRALQSARMVAVPSLSEGGPRIALEAMALGLPVIATPVGVLPDVIQSGENGLLVPPDLEAWAIAIDRLAGDSVLRERISAQARLILERFERKKLVREYAEFLKRC